MSYTRRHSYYTLQWSDLSCFRIIIFCFHVYYFSISSNKILPTLFLKINVSRGFYFNIVNNKIGTIIIHK